MSAFSKLFPAPNQGFPQIGSFGIGAGGNSVQLSSLPTPDRGLFGDNGALAAVARSAGSTAITPRANETVTYHYNVLVPYSNRPETDLQIELENVGTVLFFHKSKGHAHLRMPDAANFASLTSVDALNAHLQKNPMDEEAVMDNFKFAGVVKNEVMRHVNRMKSRVFNLAVGYRVLCQNYWRTCGVSCMDNLAFKLVTKGGRVSLEACTQWEPWENVFVVGYASSGAVKNNGNVHTSSGWPCEEMIEVYVRL